MNPTKHHHRTQTAAVALALIAMAFVAGGTLATPFDLDLRPEGLSVPTKTPGLTPLNLWETRTDQDGATDRVRAIAVTPASALLEGLLPTVYVTGTTDDDTEHWLTVAYDGLTGEELWQATLVGPGASFDDTYAITVSPDGLTVYVTGSLRETYWSIENRFSVAAYDATNGNELWVTSLTTDRGEGRAVTATDDAVFVAGTDAQPGQLHRTITTIALDPADDGAILWEARFDGDFGSSLQRANGIATDGERVYVTGRASIESSADFIVLAYDVNGEPDIPQPPLWYDHYNHAGGWDYGHAIAVEDDIVVATGRVFESTSADPPGTGADFYTVAYDTATGNRLWADNFDYEGTTHDESNDIVIHDGVAYAIGSLRGETSADQYQGVVAYDLENGGDPLWHATISGPGERAWGHAGAIAGILGNTLVVFGEGYGISCCRVLLTTGLDITQGGTQLWQAIYDTGSTSSGTVGAVSPLGDRTFVAGTSRAESGAPRDWAVIGYLTP